MDKNITDRHIARIILFLARKSQGYIGTALSKYNISTAEEPFMMALQYHKEVSQETLTALVGVDKAATSRAVKSLEEKGYLVRIRDERDKRKYRIHLTDTAKQIMTAVKNELFYFNNLLTQEIEPHILEQTYTTLLQMAENLENILKENKNSSTQGR